MSKAPQVFLWKTSFASQESIQLLYEELSENERETMENISRDRRLVEFVCGRYLLRKIFRERFQVVLPAQLSKPGEKPQVREIFPFNISHSKQFVSFVINRTAEVGLDIEVETVNRDVLKLTESYATSEERSLFENAPIQLRNDLFYKIWSMKESFAKATGDGLSMELQELEFDTEKRLIVQSPKNRPCTIFYAKAGDLHCSITILAEEAVEPQIFEVELENGVFSYKKLENVHFEKFVFVVPRVAANY